ncbi:MAG: prepilin-type N-terminal cleavage/methylation domain-containing protein [Kiritimatiellae bacterium]|nr:prepilin-type N-terminal cleavage/methylation domain-containing protein [Kiritimatiellia bacterium]
MSGWKTAEKERGRGRGAGRPLIRNSEFRIPNSESAFTLVELLVVIAIMGILLVAAMPAFNQFRQRGLNTAISPLVSTLRLARQYAVTQRRYVWVVFPGDDDVTSYNGAQVLYAFRSYAVIMGNASGQPSEYVSSWKYLPPGIYFDKDYASDSDINIFALPASVDAFPFPKNKDPSVQMHAIEFRPNGRGYKMKKGGTDWTHFSVTHVPVISASVSVNTNNGQVTSYFIPANQTNDVVVRVWNMTGQIDVMWNQ